MEPFYTALLYKVASDIDMMMCDSDRAWTGQTEDYPPKIQDRAQEIHVKYERVVSVLMFVKYVPLVKAMYSESVY